MFIIVPTNEKHNCACHRKKKKKKKEKERERERERGGEIVFDAQKQFSKMLQCAKTNPNLHRKTA
jgi:hypothetical protein